jgi:hypothetical protein
VEEARGRRKTFVARSDAPLDQGDVRHAAAEAGGITAPTAGVGSNDVGQAERLVALIAEPGRLRVFSALALGASTVRDITAMTGLDARTVEKALGRLISGDLVVREPDGSARLVTEELLVVARRAAANRRLNDELEGPAGASAVLRRFFRGGRLSSIPATTSKRLVVLDYLVQSFEPGRRYPEAAVNDILSRYHSDVASLRRYLVDEGLMERAEGHYWRSGGTFEV